MKDFKTFILIVVSLFILVNCQGSKNIDRQRTEVIHGVKHIYNPEIPLKGRVTLQVQKVFQIDPDNLNINNPPLFQKFEHGENGETFLIDNKAVRVYRFDKDGSFKGAFLRKGNGPGEMPYVSNFSAAGNKLWIKSGRRLAIFDSEGNFLEEKKLKFNYYPVVSVDNKRFIANFSIYENDQSGKKKRKNLSALLDLDNKKLVTFFETDNPCRIEIFKENFRMVFSNWLITPNIFLKYDGAKNLLYLSLSNEYKIFVMDLAGVIHRIIHRSHQAVELGKSEKTEISNWFKQFSDAERKLFKSYLPDHFCVIRGFGLLPGGRLAVLRIKGIESYEIDIFDNEGRFIYTLLMPEDFPEQFEFHEDRIAALKEEEDSYIYMEYQVLNLPDIFGDGG